MLRLKSSLILSLFALFSLGLSRPGLADDGIQFKKSSEKQTQADVLVAGWESEKLAFGWMYEVPLLDTPDKMPAFLRALYRQLAVGELVKNEIKFLPKPDEMPTDRLDAQLFVQKTTVNALVDVSSETVAYRTYLGAKLKEFNAKTDGAAINQAYENQGAIIDRWKKMSSTSASVSLKTEAPAKTVHTPIDMSSGMTQSQQGMARSNLNDLKLALQRKDASAYLRAAKTLRHMIESPSFTQAVRNFTANQYQIYHRVDGLLFEATRAIEYSRLNFITNNGEMKPYTLDAAELLNDIYLRAGSRASTNSVAASLAALLYHQREGDVPFDEEAIKAVAAGAAADSLKTQLAAVLAKTPKQIDAAIQGAIL